jgi:hypothetical protein
VHLAANNRAETDRSELEKAGKIGKGLMISTRGDKPRHCQHDKRGCKHFKIGIHIFARNGGKETANDLNESQTKVTNNHNSASGVPVIFIH